LNKYIPNIISIIRIVFSVLLIFTLDNPYIFILLYLIIGLLDILDGFIARKYDIVSNLGARLDSIADLIFYLILTYIFISLYYPILTLNHKLILLAIILVRLINIGSTKIKYGKIVFIHTITNKISGLLLFLLPIILMIYRDNFIISVIFTFAFIAALEEFLMTVFFKGFDLNRKSIFLK
jgi:CDP-diacylglycerol--glycerol-3-phosphate 3-phosphatidyltransferase